MTMRLFKPNTVLHYNHNHNFLYTSTPSIYYYAVTVRSDAVLAEEISVSPKAIGYRPWI